MSAVEHLLAEVAHHRPLELLPAQADTPPEGLDGLPLLSPDVVMKTAIQYCEASGHLVALVQDGRLAGVIGEREIYRGILRQTGAT